ncbi:MAG: formylglycine-generating enzyme family protein [Nitrospira sp.]
MLETKFKVALLVAVLAAASLPIIGILRGTVFTPYEQDTEHLVASNQPVTEGVPDEEPVREEMVSIPAGPFIRGTDKGGFDELPQQTLYLSGFLIDKYEVTNFQYAAFVQATGHRKSGPPSRYAKNMDRMRGVNQPVVYVSWDDAVAYCAWKGKRLPTEAEWEKAMRGTDGRLWPWGTVEIPHGANWARVDDGHEVSAPVGAVKSDVSPFGVMDGAGNVMEWVEDWYQENAFRDASASDPRSPDHGTFRVIRGAGYASSGSDLRITSRNKMVPDFRDETIGFRCAQDMKIGGESRAAAERENHKKSK